MGNDIQHMFRYFFRLVSDIDNETVGMSRRVYKSVALLNEGAVMNGLWHGVEGVGIPYGDWHEMVLALPAAHLRHTTTCLYKLKR